MNLLRIPITAILLLAFGRGMNSQEPPKPVLVDEFGMTTCEFVLAKTDAFAAVLKSEPHSVAYILINHFEDRPEHALRRRRLISSTLQLRGIEPERISFYLGDRRDLRTQYWKMPAGSRLPNEKVTPWNEPSPDPSRAFVFGYDDELGICPTFVPRAFAKVILENPGSYGRIVVESGPEAMLNKWYYAEQLINELVENQNVPRNRLRLVFAKGKARTAATFWFIPANTK